MRQLTFERWTAEALSYVEISHSPGKMLAMLAGSTEPRKFNGWMKKPCETLISLIERISPQAIHQLQYKVGPDLIMATDSASEWDQNHRSRIERISQSHSTELGSRPIVVEDVAAQVLLEDGIQEPLRRIGLDAPAIAAGLRVAMASGSHSFVGGQELVRINRVKAENESGRRLDSICPERYSGNLLVGARDGSITALDYPGMTRLWSADIADSPITRLSSIVSNQAVSAGSLVAAEAGPTVVLVDLAKQMAIRSVSIPARVCSISLHSSLIAAVGTCDGLLSIVDLSKGTIIRSRKLPTYRDTSSFADVRHLFPRQRGHPGDATATLIADQVAGQPVIITASDRGARAWTIPNLRQVVEWQLPERVASQPNDKWHTINRAYICNVTPANELIIGADCGVIGLFKIPTERRSFGRSHTILPHALLYEPRSE